MTWYYEHRNYYKHSYVILETNLLRGGKKLYFASEKNDLGVIWFQLPSHTSEIKIEHDGSDSGRTPTYKFKKVGTNVKLGELKEWSRLRTSYDLLSANCHYYAEEMLSKFVAKGH